MSRPHRRRREDTGLDLARAIGGFSIGVAGLLLCLATSGLIDVTWVPDTFDQFFLLGNAALAAVMGALTLLRD